MLKNKRVGVLVSRDLPTEEEVIQTQLHRKTSEDYYTYSNVPWKLYLRKEVGSILLLFQLSVFL